MKTTLLFVALVASLCLFANAQRLSTSTVISTDGNSTTTWTFANISLPLLSVTLTVDGTGVTSATSANVTYSITSTATGIMLDSSQLPITSGSSNSIRSIVPPCQIDASDSVSVVITTNGDVSGLNATLQIEAISSDVYNGNFVVATPAQITSNTSDEFFYASLFIPNTANSTQYAVNISLQDTTAGSTIPFTTYCLREANCTAPCILSGNATSQKLLTISFVPAKGVNYFASFAVTPASIGHDSVTLTTTATPSSANASTTASAGTSTGNSSTTATSASTTGENATSSASRTGIFLGFLFVLAAYLF